MKKLLTLTVLLVLFAMGNIAEAAANWKNLEVYNNTGHTIYRLYLSPKGYNGVMYGDRLADEVLYDGGSTTIKYIAGYKYYEIKIVFENGESREWTGDSALNFEGSTMLIFLPGENGRFRAKVD